MDNTTLDERIVAGDIPPVYADGDRPEENPEAPLENAVPEASAAGEVADGAADDAGEAGDYEDEDDDDEGDEGDGDEDVEDDEDEADDEDDDDEDDDEGEAGEEDAGLETEMPGETEFGSDKTF